MSQTATAALIATATEPKTRRRRSEARAKLAGLAVAYLRVSTEEQADSGLGLEAQRAEIEALAERRGVTIVGWFTDAGISAATMGKRPQFLAALAALDAGQAGQLLAKDVTRISRSSADLGALLSAATADGWCVATADGLVDTCDPTGAMLPMFLGLVGDLERKFTSIRTKQALTAAKARGTKLGKTSTLPAHILEHITTERDAGSTWQAIADRLNADSVPTGQGGSTWRPSSVRAAYVAAQRG
jgi:DNA invertase Pin-like site-specific DNA recombinase